MVKKVSALMLCGLMLFGYVYAASLTSNASPVQVRVDGTTQYQNITFEYPTRNLTIYNNDSAQYIFVDLTSDTNTNDRGRCIAIGPGDWLDFYDFNTNGISILADNGTFSPIGEASPVYVISTY